MAVRSASRSASAASRADAGRAGSHAKPAKWSVPPVLVRQVRNGTVESVHRGDIVEVDAAGRMLHVIGDPDRVVNLRSAMKPFGLIALLRAGGRREFDLTGEELAVMTSSHSGEDVHVRTIQALYRRLGIPQSVLACGAEGMPLDALTAARLARDGERPSALRHMCSGQHTVFVLLAKLGGWELETYWHDDHPAQAAVRDAIGAAFAADPARIRTGIDNCGILTYAFPLREVARAYAILADPEAVPAGDPRTAIAAVLLEVRDAMLAYPELVGGTRDRLDTSLMKAAEGRCVSKGGAEGLRGIGILRGSRNGSDPVPASGLAIKIEDGDGRDRGPWGATVEAMRQVGLIEGQALRVLARYHRPVVLDPHGRQAAESIAEFVLAPVGELVDPVP
jgi:L-asparaginase II